MVNWVAFQNTIVVEAVEEDVVSFFFLLNMINNVYNTIKIILSNSRHDIGTWKSENSKTKRA